MSDGEPLETIGTELTVAVELADGFTGGPARGSPTVHATNLDVPDHEAPFVTTPSGYHALVDAPADPTTLELTVDSELYLPTTRSVDRSTLDPDDPVVTVELVPGPAYPFGGGVTLVRGVVTADGDPLDGASVAYAQGSATTATDAAGEYALPITDIERDDVATESRTRMLKPGGDDPTVTSTHSDDGTTVSADVTLPVGGTASASLDL